MKDPDDSTPNSVGQYNVTLISSENQLGRYQLLKILGRGGMGIVYQAYDSRLERTVALKVLPPEISANARVVQRFEREAKYSARLRHPNIVALYDFEQVETQYLLTMDFIEGVCLDKYLQETRPSLAKICSLILEILDAVSYAHSLGIIHRDLKPANILVDKTGKAIVTDFGLAKVLAEDSRLSQSGAIIGTPVYMSPEQASPDPKNPVDMQSDVYSVGAIFYEMLTGKRVVDSDEPLVNVLYSVIHKEVTKVREVNPEIPEALECVCMKALAKKKGDRYVSAVDMAKDIREYLGIQPALETIYIGKAPRRSIALKILAMSVMALMAIWGIYMLGALAHLYPSPFIKPPAVHGGDAEKAPAALEAPPDMPVGWPLELWQACYDEGQKWLDFTSEQWVNLEHGDQVKFSRAYQQWYAKMLKVTPEREIKADAAKIFMVLIPPGKFWMGHFHHRVTVSKPFWIGKYEITTEQWFAVMGKNPSGFSKEPFTYPVECVSWSESREFCTKTKLLLPTEAQWEYACRAGTTEMCYWGDMANIGDYVWHGENGTYCTHLVGHKKPNAWQLYDMGGNVWEWCSDWYAEDHPAADTVDPQGPSTGIKAVVRGGCYASGADYSRSAARHAFDPGFRDCILGMRVVQPHF